MQLRLLIYGYDTMGREETAKLITNPPQQYPYFQYYYDANSNVTKRQTLLNETAQIYTYDALNRMTERVIQAQSYVPSDPDHGIPYNFSVEAYG